MLCNRDIFEHRVLPSFVGQFLETYYMSSLCANASLSKFCSSFLASQQLPSAPPPPSTRDLLLFSSHNSVFKPEPLLSAPDSARFELLMSRFSLPLGSSGNSWTQSGLIGMHNAHTAFYFVEFYS